MRPKDQTWRIRDFILDLFAEIVCDVTTDRVGNGSVATAADGRRALDYLRTSSPPKVIILDLMMPVMDGWEFLEHQAHDPALTNIPIVVLSATESPQPTKVNAILQKPVQVDAFVELVEQFLPH